MRRKILLFVLLIVLCVALFYKSPFSALYNYNTAKKLYDAGKYEQSLPYFEKSLFANSKSLLPRFFYAAALSKAKPTYSVQKKLYEIANSSVEDEAKKYAKSQLLYMRNKLIEDIDNNYIYSAPMGKDILRWDLGSFPLKVYKEDTDTVPSYYVEAIDRALKQWTNRTNFVKFTEATSAADADILIRFKNIPNDVCSGGVCKYTVAYTEPKIDKNKILQQMVLTFYRTNPRNKNFTEREIFNTALHELGHTLGIMGHSDTSTDIMFAIKDDNNPAYRAYISEDNSLTMRDLRTLVLLYRIKPDISNVKDPQSETFYYSPLIIGEKY